MQISKTGVDLIKRFEGLELQAYRDVAGVWTIGYGHTENVKEGMRISAREAEALLIIDLESRVRFLESWMFRHKVIFNQNQFDAVVSFIYNVGRSNFSKSSVAKYSAASDFEKAADSFRLWNKATINGVLVPVLGLTRRRAAEMQLFIAPDIVDETPNDPKNVLFDDRQITNIRPHFDHCERGTE